MIVAFYLAAAVAVLATLLVIIARNAVHALLYLVVSLFAVAVIFYLLGAPFAAALEIIIYAGAIVVLFVFVVMMLNLGETGAAQESSWLRGRYWMGPSVLAAILLAQVLVIVSRGQPLYTQGDVVSAQAVGLALYGPYVLAVEIAGLLLLAALVGAYHLGARKSGGED